MDSNDLTTTHDAVMANLGAGIDLGVHWNIDRRNYLLLSRQTI
ncbi:hypothetical protein [Reichenbachiella ulvae]|uniref:Uncharacterized protein n=1 Tax=Reichenbachiella ulvae TaxID=2980104 RepID=A0ABT3D0U3_9BACT|nr:hypothetical protein [Reichenbachiella ulvae]MCV9389547.1 hypothetical protein [Reichenbachiella ulvae]